MFTIFQKEATVSIYVSGILDSDELSEIGENLSEVLGFSDRTNVTVHAGLTSEFVGPQERKFLKEKLIPSLKKMGIENVSAEEV